MKISKKLLAWIAGSLVVIGLFLFTLLNPPEDLQAFVPIYATTINAIVLLTFAFIGGKTWKDFIRSKYYKPMLDDTLSEDERERLMQRAEEECD